MTMGEVSDKIAKAIRDVPELRDSKLMEIRVDATHETEGIIVSHWISTKDGKRFITTVAYK